MTQVIGEDDRRAIEIIREMNQFVLAEVNRLFTFLKVTPEESRHATEQLTDPVLLRNLDQRQGAIASMAMAASIADHVLATLGPASIDRSSFSTLAGQRLLNMAAITCLGLQFTDWDDLITRVIDGFHPLALHGRRFMDGRKPGSVGRVRLAVRQVLKKNPSANAAAVWAALKAKPPKGMTLNDNRLGKYIETETKDGIDTTGYRRFATIVSEEKNSS